MTEQVPSKPEIPPCTLKALAEGSLGFADEGGPEDATIKEMAKELLLSRQRIAKLGDQQQANIQLSQLNAELLAEAAQLRAEVEHLKKQIELHQEVAANREWWIRRLKQPVSDEECVNFGWLIGDRYRFDPENVDALIQARSQGAKENKK